MTHKNFKTSMFYATKYYKINFFRLRDLLMTVRTFQSRRQFVREL